VKLSGLLFISFFVQLSTTTELHNLNFSGKDVPLQDIFRIIKCQTGVVFFYEEVLLIDTKPVTVNWKNVTLENALNEIFKDQPITWVLEKKTVTVIKRPMQNSSQGKGVFLSVDISHI